jgi:hypothetical protein
MRGAVSTVRTQARRLSVSMLAVTLGVLACGAVGASGAMCPEELRSELHSELLPDCRAYELVTPPYKEGGTVNPFAVSEFGSRAVGGSFGVFDHAEGDPLDPQVEGAAYLFSREVSGWSASPLEPSEKQYQSTAIMLDVGSEFSASLWAIGTLDQALGVVDLYIRGEDGSLVKIGSPTSTVNVNNETQYQYLGASGDLSHVLFEVRGGGFRWPFDHTVGGGSLYEYVGTGNAAPLLVGVDGGRESTNLISECGTRLGSGVAFQPFGSMYNAISADGSRVFFTALGGHSNPCSGAQPPVDELLVREEFLPGQLRTVPVSESSLGYCAESPASCRDAEFEGASLDGSKAFFTSTQLLTEGASEDPEEADSATQGCSQTAGPGGCNLYEYESEAGGGHRLVAVSSGSPEPRVQGVARISEDGSHVYFVARGALAKASNSRGEEAREGADNLYLFERDARYPAGHTAFIVTLPPSDGAIWAHTDNRPVQSSRDGRFLVFTSLADLTHEEDTEGIAQVYRYDAQSGELARVSIGQGGYNDNGRRPVYDASIAIGPAGASLPYAYASNDSPVATGGALAPDDGTVFFASPTALTPQALSDRVNPLGHPIPNIYEYRGGMAYLISDGRDISTVHASAGVHLLGESASGADVFFTTSDPLVPRDGDTQQDIYDARVDGGFSEPLQTPCAEEGCQGPLALPPLLSSPGSAGESAGAGGESATAAVKAAPKVKRKATRRKAARKKSKAKSRRRGKSSSARSRRAAGGRG